MHTWTTDRNANPDAMRCYTHTTMQKGRSGKDGTHTQISVHCLCCVCAVAQKKCSASSPPRLLLFLFLLATPFPSVCRSIDRLWCVICHMSSVGGKIEGGRERSTTAKKRGDRRRRGQTEGEEGRERKENTVGGGGGCGGGIRGRSYNCKGELSPLHLMCR